MKVAWVTPYARQSAIGKFSAIVCDTLGEVADVTLVLGDATPPESMWSTGLPNIVLSQHALPDQIAMLRSFDCVFYNLGNNVRNHSLIYELSRRLPGVIVLHDLVMHHFFYSYLVRQCRDGSRYRRELAFSHGQAGADLAASVLAGAAHHVWDQPVMLDFHMARSAIAGAYAVVVHSKSTATALKSLASCPVHHVPFPAAHQHGVLIDKGRSQRSTGSRVRLLTFGVINSNKLVHAVIEALAGNPDLRDAVIYDVIGDGTGQPAYYASLQALIKQHGLGNTVRLLGHQPDDVLEASLTDADIVINLRSPHFGESSWVLLEAMTDGKPVVVWRHGYYDEMPDDTVVKVSSDRELAAALRALVGSISMRQAIAVSAKRYASDVFRTELYCQRLIEIAAQVTSDTAVYQLADRIADEVATRDLDSSFTDIINQLAGELSLLVSPVAYTQPAAATVVAAPSGIHGRPGFTASLHSTTDLQLPMEVL